MTTATSTQAPFTAVVTYRNDLSLKITTERIGFQTAEGAARNFWVGQSLAAAHRGGFPSTVLSVEVVENG